MASTRTRRARAAKRRSTRIARVVNDLTPAQWVALQVAWGGCAYCGAVGVAVQRDCVQPIAHGGRSTVTNVVPACRSCNASKCEQEVTGWLRRKKLEEGAFLLRQLGIVRALAGASRLPLQGLQPHTGAG
jgi:5-methylcytosine-specific restriction endonuclease McrA